jgi:hypothetical protein
LALRECGDFNNLPPPAILRNRQMFVIQNIRRLKEKMGIASINRQIQEYVANHNKAGPKTKVK